MPKAKRTNGGVQHRDKPVHYLTSETNEMGLARHVIHTKETEKVNHSRSTLNTKENAKSISRQRSKNERYKTETSSRIPSGPKTVPVRRSGNAIAWAEQQQAISNQELPRWNQTSERKARKKNKLFNCCRCSPFCIACSILTTLLLLAGLSALIVALMKKNTNRATTVPTVSSVASWTDTTVSTTTVTTATTSTTTSTTTTAFYCGLSCLNQSWIDSSGGIASWPFEGSYADVVGSYNGTPSVNPPTFVTGYLGQAASFDASMQQAISTPFIQFNNVSFTVEVWIKPTGYPNPSDYSIVGLCSSQSNFNCLHINIRNSVLYFGFYYNDSKGQTQISLNKWVHTAFVFDSIKDTQTIYLNGFQDSLPNTVYPLKQTSGNFTIGTNQVIENPNSYFQGYIDQLAINQRVKSACEIQEIATLAARFKFDASAPYSDSGPNAVSTTSASTSIITGYNNQAVSFSGLSTSYFQAWGFTSLGISNQSFSITLWMQPQSLAGTLVHLSSSSAGTGSVCFPLLGFASNGAIVAQVLTSSLTVVSATGPILPVSSSWIPVVQTWSSTNGLKLYVNNTLVSSTTAATFVGSGLTPNYVTIGNCLSGCAGSCRNGLVSSAGPFKGAIDDCRIYSYELTVSDVCTLFITT